MNDTIENIPTKTQFVRLYIKGRFRVITFSSFIFIHHGKCIFVLYTYQSKNELQLSENTPFKKNDTKENACFEQNSVLFRIGHEKFHGPW